MYECQILHINFQLLLRKICNFSTPGFKFLNGYFIVLLKIVLVVVFVYHFCSKTIGKRNKEIPNYFVQALFRTWKNAIEKFKEFENKKYDQDAVEDAKNFKLTYENVKHDVIGEINHS